jgi:nucleoside phosphorylase
VPDQRLLATADELQKQMKKGNFRSIDEKTNNWFKVFSKPKVGMHRGTFLSIDSVVADGSISHGLRSLVANQMSSSVIGVEMEGAGLLSAASLFDASKSVLMIRGVSDFADEKKNDSDREVACKNSAFVSLEVIRRYYTD